MTDRDRPAADIDSPIDLPIQPTGHGVADIEIARLHAAVEDGIEDPAIDTPLPDDALPDDTLPDDALDRPRD